MSGEIIKGGGAMAGSEQVSRRGERFGRRLPMGCPHQRNQVAYESREGYCHGRSCESNLNGLITWETKRPIE